MATTYLLDPQARLDFAMEWGPVPDAPTPEERAGWLRDGETITDHLVTGVGVTVESSAVVGTQVVAWLTEGVAGAASATFQITSSEGRVDERTMKIRVKQR